MEANNPKQLETSFRTVAVEVYHTIDKMLANPDSGFRTVAVEVYRDVDKYLQEYTMFPYSSC